jgi:hypothetical protein
MAGNNGHRTSCMQPVPNTIGDIPIVGETKGTFLLPDGAWAI